MSSAATPPPPAPTEPPAAGGRKKMWVLVLVAVLIVAALATVAVLMLSTGPTGPSLDHVTVTASATSLYVTQSVTITAVAVDTASVAQTANATFAWSASPSGSATITPGTSANVVRVTAKAGGSISVTANATWKGTTKSNAITLTATGLAFVLSSSNYHPLVPYNATLSPFVLTVTAVTAANVTYTNYQGTVHFTSSDTNAILPADATFSVANAGVMTFLNVSIILPGAVTIAATDTAFSSVTGTMTVYGNRAPTASFTVTPNTTDPRIISVDGSASSDPDTGQTATLSYGWAFGDGGTGSGVTATHTYAVAGPYSVALTVSDVYGASNTLVKSYVAHSPPVAVVSVKSQSPNGLSILVWANGSKSTGGDGSIVYYNWTWGDGNQSQTTISLAAHNYSSFWNGKSVTLTLRVASNYSLTNTSSVTFIVTTSKLPPVATFTSSFVVGPVVNGHTYRTLSVDASGSNSPTGAALLYYVWKWGDSSPDSNVTTATTTHQYFADGAYVVNLTVIDANMLKGYFQTTVTITVPAAAPVAVFIISHVKLVVSVDASGTTDVNNNIAFYIWQWGDSSPNSNTTGPTTTHAYGAAGLFTITLTVWDLTNLKGTATGLASVADSTLDYSFYDFFNVPYGEWWDMRNHAYGDLPINTNCFNATSIADGICSGTTNPGLPANESYPYTNWYPAPFGSLFYQQPSNDPLIYAPYRMRVIGSSVPNYDLTNPVFLPVMNTAAAAGNLLQFSWNMQYLDHKTAAALDAAGCPGSLAKFDDGFMIQSQVYLTMDYQEAQRIWGVTSGYTTPTQIRNWFAGGINPACGTSGTLETAYSNFMTNQGNGPYDIWNTFQYPYTQFYTNMSAPIVDSNLNIHMTIDMTAWGTEALLARWFYWGQASYATNYLDSSKAKGWWGMELAWWEDFHFNGDLTSSSMDFSLNAVMQYHFQQGAYPGPDKVYRTSGSTDTDDVPLWTWGPWLSDYVASSKSHPYSELTRWSGMTYVHSTPGGSNYGKSLAYDYAPLSWAAKFGETWHFVFPAAMQFYDPVKTPIPANPIGGFQLWGGTRQYGYQYYTTNPVNYGTYTNSTWYWDVAGNVSALPLTWPQQDGTGTYPIQPWGSITFVPWGAKVKVASATVTRLASVAPGGTPGVGTPVLSAPVFQNSLLFWTATLVTAPALWRPATSRIRV